MNVEPPDWPLVLMDEAAIEPALDADIKTLLMACFPEDRAVFANSRHWHGTAPAFVLVHIGNGRTAGHVGVVLRTVAWGGTPLAAAGIQSLAVAPTQRRTGLSRALMTRAVDEARCRAAACGLLFCVPALERFYASLGWQRLEVPIVMRDPHGRPAPIPAKNIGMALGLGGHPLPTGPLDLLGRDW